MGEQPSEDLLGFGFPPAQPQPQPAQEEGAAVVIPQDDDFLGFGVPPTTATATATTPVEDSYTNGSAAAASSDLLGFDTSVGVVAPCVNAANANIPTTNGETAAFMSSDLLDTGSLKDKTTPPTLMGDISLEQNGAPPVTAVDAVAAMEDPWTTNTKTDMPHTVVEDSVDLIHLGDVMEAMNQMESGVVQQDAKESNPDEETSSQIMTSESLETNVVEQNGHESSSPLVVEPTPPPPPVVEVENDAVSMPELPTTRVEEVLLLDVVPNEQVPVEEVSTMEELAVEVATMDDIATKEEPIEESPISDEHAPPVEEESVKEEAPPVEEVPTLEAPPVIGVPSEEAPPVVEASMNQVLPVEEVATEEAPPVEEVLKKEVPPGIEAPMEDAPPVVEAPMNEVPPLEGEQLEEELMEDVSIEEAQIEETPMQYNDNAQTLLSEEVNEEHVEEEKDMKEVEFGNELEGIDEQPPISQTTAVASKEPSTADPELSPKPVTDAVPSWALPASSPLIVPTSAAPAGRDDSQSPAEVTQRESSAAPGAALPPIDSTSYVSAMTQEQEDTGPNPEAQALIIELQNSIQEHLKEREAAEARARASEQRVKELEGVVSAKKQLEVELAKAKESLESTSSDKEHLLVELDKLRENRDEHERKQIVLSNRLNAAKKKEAAKANLAESLEEEVKGLKQELESTQKKLEELSTAKVNQSTEMSALKEEYAAKLKKAEGSLAEERRLNDERKKKMKLFVENKQEEIREAKSQNDELNMELSQTNRSLREHHARWKQLHAQWVQSQTRNRELQRDLNRMKKESESMSRMGDQMKGKLDQSAQATEEHKNKRLTAKQELMTVLATLEAERDVSNKLRDSIKFTFTPKALSQQQILKESLRDFEHELTRLSQRLGKPLPPSQDTPIELFALNEDDESESDGINSTSAKRSRSEIDSTHLLANLEEETQRVSQCIMALTSNIERMHMIIAQSGERSCATLLTDILAGAGGGATMISATSGEEAASMTRPRVALGATRSYGQIPTVNN